MADWQEQRRRAVDAHAAALERQRAAETARAHELVAAFARTARERGLRAVRLRARGYNGRSTYRTRVRGWYLRPDRSIAVGEDGGYYVLAVPGGLWAKLTGVVVDDRGNRFRSPNRQQWIGASTVSSLFNADGFVNAGVNQKEIKSFFPSLSSAQHKLILKSPVDVEVLTVPVDWPLNNPLFPPPFNFNSPDPNVKRINPVRYVASPHATNNPATFDLWAEYVEGKKVKIICNWSKDILEK